LVIDTYGYSTGAGQLKVQSPQRLLDTRDAATWPFGIARAGSKVIVQVAGRGGVPSDAAAALLTVTVANATGDGFVTVWPCDAALPNASTINTWAGQLRSNLALVELAANGTACLQLTSLHGTPVDLIVDAAGWTTGGPARPNISTTPIAPVGGILPAPGSPIANGPLGGPGCSLANAAFCDTFDAPKGAGTRTGDLDPVLWGVSRIGDVNPGQAANNIVSAHLQGCGGSAATPPPGDVRICDGQMLEALNDGGGVVNLDTYPKQPFSFGGRTGKVVFDVSADSDGSHGAWPEFAITDEPVPGVRRSISGQVPAHAQNSIGFSIDAGCVNQPNTTGIGVIFYTVDGVYNEVQNSRPNCVTKGSRTAMNHFEVRVSQGHIEVWGTDAGSTTLKQLAVEDIPGGLAFNQGLVWLNDVHYNARKAVEPCACGTQFDHTFAWDNLGFDGPKTYRDLGYDVADANAATSNRSINGDGQTEQGYQIGTGPQSFTVTGVTKGSATKAKVVFNDYTFDAGPTMVSINGHAAVAADWRSTDATFAWRSVSVEVPLSDVVGGDNTLTFTSGSASTIIANVSLILVAAAPVP
ncbi:MAG: hypothetical protein JWM12_1293, partial [Ilumatobacteraceae bacterium]|nr:hypothetical protein [Ilumatobacteraceae bacterium]